VSSSNSAGRPWYEAAFDADYLERYASRSVEAARAESAFIAQALTLPQGSALLDLCCGAGRHTKALADLGFSMTGVDLSAALLEKASLACPSERFLRADARKLPLADASFNGVINIFTSFGYFETDAEHVLMLREAARVLKPGGVMLMDFMNEVVARKALVPKTEREAGGAKITEDRVYREDSRRIEKRITIRVPGLPDKELKESVRAYSAQELESLFNQAGFKIRARYGDLAGAPFDAAASPRVVLVAVR